VAELKAFRVGEVALHLGAGRQTKDDRVDHAVGIVCLRKRGDRVTAGEALAVIHAQTDEAATQAAQELLAAYQFAGEPAPERPVVLDVLA
jgi:pyrimidine-nucleoside phosphorylase